jgi:hypothetical protein
MFEEARSGEKVYHQGKLLRPAESEFVCNLVSSSWDRWG